MLLTTTISIFIDGFLRGHSVRAFCTFLSCTAFLFRTEFGKDICEKSRLAFWAAAAVNLLPQFYILLDLFNQIIKGYQ